MCVPKSPCWFVSHEYVFLYTEVQGHLELCIQNNTKS